MTSVKDEDRNLPKYNENYLNGLIAKAKKSWESIDVDSFMANLRDEEDAEKEQKALDNFRKAMEE